jgi:hypothetical protein
MRHATPVRRRQGPGAGRLRVARPRTGYPARMKPKTMFYTAVGFVTYKAGKIFAKRKAREMLRPSDTDKKN